MQKVRFCILTLLLLVAVSHPLAQKPKAGVNRPGNSVTPSSPVEQTRDQLIQIFGASVFDLHADVDNENVLYATTPTGVFKTENGGKLWGALFRLEDHNKSKSDRVLFAQSPTSPAVMYVASKFGGLWKTVDRGQVWLDVTAGMMSSYNDPQSLVVSVEDPNTVFVAFDESVLKTLNGGRSWGRLPSPRLRQQSKTSLLMNPSNPSHLIYDLDANGSAYQSFDGGMTWLEKGVVEAKGWDKNGQSRVLNALTSARIASGDDWQTLHFDDAERKSRNAIFLNPEMWKAIVHDVAVGTDAARTIYVATDIGLFVSKNNGQSFARLWHGANAILPVKSGMMYFAASDGVFRYSPVDDKLASVSFGLPRMLDEQNFNRFMLCGIDEPTNTLTLCKNGYLVSTENDGANWHWKEVVSRGIYRTWRATRAKDGTFFLNIQPLDIWGHRIGSSAFVRVPPNGSGSYIFDVRAGGTIGAVSASDPKVIYQGTSVSDDGGFSWRKLSIAEGLGSNLTNIASPVSPRISYVHDLSKNAVYVTTDLGDSWRLVAPPDATTQAAVIYPDHKDPNTVYWMSKDALFRSTNVGLRWSRLTPSSLDLGELRDISVSPSDSSRIFVSSSRGLWKTANGGRTWQVVSDGYGGDSLTNVLASEKIVLVRGDFGIYRLAGINPPWASEIKDWAASLTPVQRTLSSENLPAKANNRGSLNEFIAIEDKAAAASLRGDRAAVSALLDDSFIYTDLDARKTHNKEKFLEKIKANKSIKSFNCYGYQLSYEGDVAVLTGSCQYTFKVAFLQTTQTNRFKDKFKLIGNDWKFIASEISMVR